MEIKVFLEPQKYYYVKLYKKYVKGSLLGCNDVNWLSKEAELFFEKILELYESQSNKPNDQKDLFNHFERFYMGYLKKAQFQYMKSLKK